MQQDNEKNMSNRSIIVSIPDVEQSEDLNPQKRCFVRLIIFLTQYKHKLEKSTWEYQNSVKIDQKSHKFTQNSANFDRNFLFVFISLEINRSKFFPMRLAKKFRLSSDLFWFA